MLKTPRAVLFDHDDTLVSTIGTKWNQHKFTAKHYYGKNITDSEIAKHWGKPLQELVCLLYDTNDADEALARNTAHHLEFPKQLFEFTLPTLRHIKNIGLLTGIITAASDFSFSHDLESLGIPRELLDYTQTSDATEHHKPDPRVFNPVLNWLGELCIEPGQVLYVGDGLHDMQAAVGAGFCFLGVETGLVSAEQFREVGAQSIPNIEMLQRIFY